MMMNYEVNRLESGTCFQFSGSETTISTLAFREPERITVTMSTLEI
jgi:hypothetical protein